MSPPRPSLLPDPGFDLEAPGTYLYTGPDSTRGRRLNDFALSLRVAANRDAFLADENGYLARFGLSEAEAALVRRRDWTGLMQAGCHLQCALKLAATLGLNLYHVGAHHIGVDPETLEAACPRRVGRTPGEG